MAENLAALERWMQTLVTHPDGPAVAVKSSAARAALPVALEDVLLPSRQLSAAERVGIYADMYFARLIEVLEEEFAGLVHLLGHAQAHALFQAYLVAHPSRHYSLNQLGAKFPAYLCDEAAAFEPRAFACELATLERTVQDVFDAPECASLASSAIAALAPEDWAHARLVPIPAFALLACEHPVNAWYTAFREERELPELAPTPGHLVVFRQEGRVWRMELSGAQHALLTALANGLALEPALLTLAEGGHDLAVLAPELQGWFHTWAAEGFFARIEG